MGLQYPSGVESESSSPRLHRTANSDGDVGGENLRSQRSSVTINWSDGSKAIFIRPPRPHSGSGWSSPFPPPPPVSAAPIAASMPTPPSSSHSRRISQVQREDSSWRGTSKTSRLSSSTRAEVDRRAPRPNTGGNERAPSRHSYHPPYVESSVGENERSSRHSHYTSSSRPSTHGRATTPLPNNSPSSRASGSNIVRPESVPINILNMRDYRSRDNTSSLQHGVENNMNRHGPAVIRVEANIIEEGSRRSSRRGRTGERNDRGAGGSGGRLRNREERNETDRRGQGNGDFMRALGRYLPCLPFSSHGHLNTGEADGYACRPRSGSRNRRSGRR
ncbi:hypothetical protein NPX13_g7472 [Xylaria arbuscula]|uniref:Uncharacterized protein n=1 Tax=Xylaria arbuscula TaxID=114810 RepID=A0A9W8TJF5_9PEZI|nr:hypothetical protein NPX13_g7472 [Xylaria arbuscula]